MHIEWFETLVVVEGGGKGSRVFIFLPLSPPSATPQF